jgi:Tol biopolymer transport system component
MSALVVGSALAVILPPQSAATPSIRNGEIAFVGSVNGQDQVFTVNPNGTRLRQVTQGGLTDASAGLSWSPDGRSLLFIQFEGGGGNQILKTRADGTGATDISPPCAGAIPGQWNGNCADGDPVYSPNGTRIAFVKAVGPPVTADQAGSAFAIFTMNANGGDPTQLTQTADTTSWDASRPHGLPTARK